MTLNPETARRVAEGLRVAERDGTWVPLPSSELPELDWEGARAIARARDELRHRDGDTHIGYKLGWTSAAMRKALGISRPNWGTLWASQVLAERLGMQTLRHAKAEPEVVYFAGRTLQGAEATAADVLDAAAGWALGIEVVHPRFESYKFDWLDNTCDNSSSHAVAVGSRRDITVDPAEIDVTFSDGATTNTGTGAQAMESPAEAVAWLVRSLAGEGLALREGQLVFTGGLTAPLDVTAGGVYRAESAALPPVEFRT